MNLWQLRRGDRFRVILQGDTRSLPFIFDHVDGAYSFCTFADGALAGEVAHISAGSSVELEPATTLSATAPEEAKGRPDAADGLREDGIRIPCNESLAQRAEKTQAPRAV